MKLCARAEYNSWTSTYLFTSRKLWGLVVSEIYIENFKEGVEAIDQMGAWVSPGHFLVYYRLTLNKNFKVSIKC